MHQGEMSEIYNGEKKGSCNQNMGSKNIQTSMSADSQPNLVPVQSPSEQSILQWGEITNTNGNVEESSNEGISSSMVEAAKSITYIHFREIP